MRTNWLRCAGLLAVIAITGCGRGKPDIRPDTRTRLGTSIDIDVGKWLDLPRADLARLADERAVTVAKQTEHAHDFQGSVALLPKLTPPQRLPVFEKATYYSAVGFSLPPYLKEGAHDGEVALHLARHGDHEAAVRLADPADTALRARLDALKMSRNYPVEWSRLVGLTLQSAQLKLASGELEGATELVCLHKQLREVLDRKAAATSLGSALLPFGRRALSGSVLAYRDPKHNKLAVAEDIEAALKDWGPVPVPAPPVARGARQADVARVFGASATGKIVLADGATLGRALDLLALPLAGEGAQAVVAFFDGNGGLVELLVTYRPKVETLYPEPAHLAHYLIDLDFGAQERPTVPGLLRQAYSGGGLVYDVARVSRPSPYGAFVRVTPEKVTAPTFPSEFRKLGRLHFDRTFEANRVALAPDKAGAVVTLSKKATLAKLVKSVGTPAPEAALLERDKGGNVLASVRLSWPPDLFLEAPTRLLPALWAVLGPGQINGVEASNGDGAITFTWEDGTTHCQFRLPFDEKSPVLNIDDQQGAARLAEREDAARKRDRSDRAARLSAGAPIRRLPRDVPALDGVELGQARAEAEAQLPRSSAVVLRRALADGWGLVYLDDAPHGATYWRREVFVRFANQRVAELRVRYEDGLREGKGPTLLQAIERASQGKPDEIDADWPGLWADVGAGKGKVVKYRWQDDLTTLTYQRDAGLVELVLRDRPVGRALGLAKLESVKPGVGPVKLGDKQKDVRAAWRTRPTKASGADVYRLRGGPYEYVMIWYKNGRVSRLVAAHKAVPGPTAADATAALQKAWTDSLNNVGFVRRQIGRQGAVLERYFWHDDRTRVQALVQSTPDGPRVFSEWRRWPVPVETKGR
jgi:hypothetical protein